MNKFIIIVIILFFFICWYIIPNTYEKFFSNLPGTHTILYGSLFLDKLNEQIKNMTDPSIKYDTKRIDITKYSDVLL